MMNQKKELMARVLGENEPLTIEQKILKAEEELLYELNHPEEMEFRAKHQQKRITELKAHLAELKDEQLRLVDWPLWYITQQFTNRQKMHASASNTPTEIAAKIKSQLESQMEALERYKKMHGIE